MTFTLTFEWWWIPAALTVLAFGWWLIWGDSKDGGGGYLAGIEAMFTLIPTLFFVMLVWLVAAIAK